MRLYLVDAVLRILTLLFVRDAGELVLKALASLDSAQSLRFCLLAVSDNLQDVWGHEGITSARSLIWSTRRHAGQPVVKLACWQSFAHSSAYGADIMSE